MAENKHLRINRQGQVKYLQLPSNIAIKHDFLCINICWAPREAFKPKPERRGFQHLPRGPANVNLSGKHVLSLLLHKNILSLENFK